MISKSIGEQVLVAALSTGGDFAEIFAEDTDSSALSLMDRHVENALSLHTRGAGIRIFQGLRMVYAYTNDLSYDGLLRTAREAAAALGAATQERAVHLCRRVATNIHPIHQLTSDIAGKKRAKLLYDMDAAARDVSPEIVQVSAGITGSKQDILICNSEGIYITDTRVRTRMTVSAVAAMGGENQTGIRGPGAMVGYELFEKIDASEQARQAAQSALTMLHAGFCPAGQMPVVIDGGFGGVIFHEACGHALEATSVSRGNSVFCDKIGQKIAADCVSAVDDGTMPGEWGSINIDDEGAPAQRNLLIENGILRGYMIDKMGARRMGMKETGSGRRQNYTLAPTSRMTNTFICAGKDDPEAMLATMGDGLYCKQMGGGSVNPVTGEFNFAVVEGYLVRDGKITSPVRGATLIGKGAQVLKDIDRTGTHMTMSQGMCGSLSGAVPTNVGQPRIRVSNMTVGGR